MTTGVKLASQALRLLRANTIASFSEGSNEADIADLYYEDFAQDILTRYPWGFSMKKRQLNLDAASPVNEWRYAHILPAESLALWALFPSSAVGAKPINQYDIQTISGGRRVFSNYQTLYGQYTIYTAESNWPPYFSHFAMHAFAAHIAIPVTDDMELQDKMQRLAWGPPEENERGGKFATACGIDARQRPPQEIDLLGSPLIGARFS